MADAHVKAAVCDAGGRWHTIYGESLASIAAARFGRGCRLSPSMDEPGWEVLMSDPKGQMQLMGRIIVDA